jgi:hypothetical protein
LNAAGLAAASAIIGGTESLRLVGIVAAALCGMGLLLAVLIMLARWKWGEEQTRRVGNYRWEISANSRPIEDLGTLVMPRRERLALYGVAIASLLLFAAAIVIVFVRAATG